MVRSGSRWSIAGCRAAEQMGQAAGADHGHGLAIFLLDARDQALDQADIAPIDARLHGGNGVAADHVLGAADGDARQQRGGLVQRLGRQIGARRDHAAVIVAVLRDDVESGGGAEIHHDQRALVALMRRHGVDTAGRRPPLRAGRLDA